VQASASPVRKKRTQPFLGPENLADQSPGIFWRVREFMAYWPSFDSILVSWFHDCWPRQRSRLRSRRHWHLTNQLAACCSVERLEPRVLLSQVGSVSVGAQTGTLIYGSAGSATYTVTVDRGTTTGAFVADLSLATTLPTNVSSSFSTSSLSFGASDNSLSTTFTINALSGAQATTTPASFTIQAAVDGNPSDFATGNGNLTITPLSVTPSILITNKTYDGTTGATISFETVTGTKPGDDVSLTGGTATFASPNVGTGVEVDISGLTLAGTDAGDYSISGTAVSTANIAALAITPVVTVSDKTYDGTTAASIVDETLTGAVPGDNVILTGGTATFSSAGVGVGIPVNITGLTLTGTAAANYTGSGSTAVTANIDPAPLTVTADNQSIVSGSPLPTLTATDSGFVNGETLATSGVTGSPDLSTTATSSSPTGPYPITVTQGTLAAINYTFEFVNGTFNVTVPGPTGLALTSTTDFGTVVDPSPTFTVSATPGSTVTFLVNGTAQVAATETSSGQFSGTLTRQDLQVGVNTITATSTNGTVASAPSASVSFTYAPSDESVYTVPGAFGSAQQITIDLTSRSAAYDNELGVFPVDDLDGTVDAIAPGAVGYSAAALSQSGSQVLFASGQQFGQNVTMNVTGGELLAFYLVSNSTTATFLKFNPQNLLTGLNTFFSVTAANPDGVQHALVTADSQTGNEIISWEDMLFGGDKDYNDAVISITPASTPSPTAGDALRITGTTGNNVPVTFALQPTQRAAGSTDAPPASTAQGEIGYFVVSDNSGTVNGIAPGSAGYLQAALAAGNSTVLFNQGDSLGTSKTIQAPGGALLGFYYIPNSTSANVLANNPNNDPSVGPVALFSFDAANPDTAQHFRWYAPEGVAVPVPPATTGQSTIFLHGVGKLFPSSTDFDDFLISITMPQ
jgi:hypothetical protein